ncbi:MAG TPA: glutaredoxin 3 [Myxococcaceae bacterium]|nr:glutaredoxin 3 [Myxococcaceae bacterium]
MPAVTIYTTVSCVFCLRAKEYLRSKGVAYEEVDVTGDQVARARLVERSNGQRTVPQIFVGDVHVGGYTDLVALDREGRFQPLLSRS